MALAVFNMALDITLRGNGINNVYFLMHCYGLVSFMFQTSYCET